MTYADFRSPPWPEEPVPRVTAEQLAGPGRRRARRRLASLAAVGIGGAVLATFAFGPLGAEVAGWTEEPGPAAAIGAVAAYAVLSLLLVPGSLLSLVAGALFGPLLGAGVAFAGGVVGSTGAFVVGRRLGRAPMQRLTGPRLRRVDQWLHDHGIVTLAIVRIIPGVPYSLLNYAAGMTGIPFDKYVKGSLLGLVPGAVAYAAVGGTLNEPLSPQFLASLGLIAVLLVAGRVGERRLSRNR